MISWLASKFHRHSTESGAEPFGTCSLQRYAVQGLDLLKCTYIQNCVDCPEVDASWGWLCALSAGDLAWKEQERDLLFQMRHERTSVQQSEKSGILLPGNMNRGRGRMATYTVGITMVQRASSAGSRQSARPGNGHRGFTGSNWPHPRLSVLAVRSFHVMKMCGVHRRRHHSVLLPARERRQQPFVCMWRLPSRY